MNVEKRLACGGVGQLVEILSSIEEEAPDEEVVGRPKGAVRAKGRPRIGPGASLQSRSWKCAVPPA
jgi:hypothetical protein